MNRDLEETLNELGPEYRAVVARLRAGGEAEPGRQVSRPLPKVLVRPTWLAAASLLVLAGLGIIFLRTGDRDRMPETACFGGREYRASVDEMIATQNPDGSWANDFLTRRNAAALKLRGDLAAQIAYKKAVRNLRARGVL